MYRNNWKQECIPVGVSPPEGCLPGGVYPGGVCLRGSAQGCVSARGGVSYSACLDAPPHGQNSWHVLVETLPFRNYVADGKNVMIIPFAFTGNKIRWASAVVTITATIFVVFFCHPPTKFGQGPMMHWTSPPRDFLPQPHPLYWDPSTSAPLYSPCPPC